MKKVFVFGNPDLEMDNLPLRILPELRKAFPEIKFVAQDPNEEWKVEEEMTVLDTAVGIKEIRVFESLEKFSKTSRISMHDFDALTNLRLLQKLGKIKQMKIICLPSGFSEKQALKELHVLLNEKSATLR